VSGDKAVIAGTGGFSGQGLRHDRQVELAFARNATLLSPQRDEWIARDN
jgi:hypothetical protein